MRIPVARMGLLIGGERRAAIGQVRGDRGGHEHGFPSDRSRCAATNRECASQARRRALWRAPRRSDEMAQRERRCIRPGHRLGQAMHFVTTGNIALAIACSPRKRGSRYQIAPLLLVQHVERPPPASVARISWKLASKPSEANCSMRAVPGNFSRCHKTRLARAARGELTPLGRPVEPEVYKDIGGRQPVRRPGAAMPGQRREERARDRPAV